MSATNSFPQGPLIDPQTGDVSLEWFMWFQNPTVTSIKIGGQIIQANSSPLAGPPGEDGQDGEDGFMGPPGPRGAQGIQGIAGISMLGQDGEDGVDGISIQGPRGIPGCNGIPGMDGQDGEDAFPIPSEGVMQAFGTWTATDASGAGLTLTTNYGDVIKIGRQITVNGSITYPVTASGAAALIGGIPYAASNPAIGAAVTNAALSLAAYLVAAQITPIINTTAAAATNAQLSGKAFVFTITYIY